MIDRYTEWVDEHRHNVLMCCRELGLSDDILDEINNVFDQAYAHPARFDFDKLQDVIAYGIREATGFSPRELMG